MPGPTLVTSTESVQSGDSWTVSTPAGAQVGDRLWVAIATDGDDNWASSGWSTLSTDGIVTGVTFFATLTILTKIAVTADISGTATFTRTPAGGLPAIVTYGVVRGGPQTVAAVTTANDPATLIAPAVNAPTPNSLVLRLYVYSQSAGGTGWATLPPGATVVTNDTASTQTCLITSDGNQAAVGSTGTETAFPNFTSGTATIARTLVFTAPTPIVGII